MNHTIIHTMPGDPNFHLFESIAKEIYPADSIRLRIPEKISTGYLESCSIILTNGIPKARVALYSNPFLKYQERRAFCVGHFESVDDFDIANELLEHVAKKAKELGAEYLIGPMNGSTWENYRFSTHNNHPNFFFGALSSFVL